MTADTSNTISKEETVAHASFAFTRASDTYDKYRPTYPEEAVDALIKGLNLENPSKNVTLIDIGAGTGKMTKLLHDRGFSVYAVELSEVCNSR